MADTIFAQATPPGRSGVAVVRISGPEARTAAERLGADRLAPRRVALRRLIRPEDGAPLDDALVLWFPGPRSFTGDDVVELHLHGGRAVCRAVLDAIAHQPGLRAAEAGEFTRRALLNGKLDLTQVEGLGDLLAAETEAQARQAMRSMDGALATAAGIWRERLIETLALIEAAIDFADEELPEDLVAAALGGMTDLVQDWGREIARCDAAERLRQGYEVALVGRPNVGKSTLLNALAGREAAITSEVPGTTRDPIEVAMDVLGLPVTFVDLAGLRDTDDAVESIGVARARSRMERADLRVVLLGPGDTMKDIVERPSEDDIILQAKADLGLNSGMPGVSGLTGEGVEALLERVHAVLVERGSDTGVLSHARHKAVLAEGCARLSAAIEGLRAEEPMELVAEDMRAAIRAVDKLVGKVDIEDVLGSIFGRFCIGK